MNRRDLLALAASLAAAPQAFAQTTANTTTAPDTTSVALTTPLGRIVVALETRRAPITSANFLAYVDGKRFDGAASFYRASRPPNAPTDDFGLIEGGLIGHPEKLLPPIAHESTRQTGLTHVSGTVSIARHAPGAAQADFFVCMGDQHYLDATETQPGFAPFGHVTEGWEVLKKILVAPVDPNRGEGSMKGEMLVQPVPIVRARRV